MQLTEERRSIQATAARFFAENAGMDRFRKVLMSEDGWDRALWCRICTDMGWQAMMVPEAFGGLGLGGADIAPVLEEAGKALLSAPLFETAVLAVQCVLQAGSESQKAAMLPALVAGSCCASVAFTGSHGGRARSVARPVLSKDGNGWRLHGTDPYVSFGHAADMLFVVADGPGSNESSLVRVPRGAAGLTVACRQTLDLTRPLALATFTGVPVEAQDILGHPGGAAAAVEHVLILAAGLLASEQTGGAAYCVESTTAYAKLRHQFGRPIGSFQAVKHDLADMMLRVEASRSAAGHAAAMIDAGGEGWQEACAGARVYCSDAFFHCASEAIQLHGGIGFTWDHPAHLYFRRARSSATWLGDAAWHRERVASLMGLDETETVAA